MSRTFVLSPCRCPLDDACPGHLLRNIRRVEPEEHKWAMANSIESGELFGGRLIPLAPFYLNNPFPWEHPLNFTDRNHEDQAYLREWTARCYKEIREKPAELAQEFGEMRARKVASLVLQVTLARERLIENPFQYVWMSGVGYRFRQRGDVLDLEFPLPYGVLPDPDEDEPVELPDLSDDEGIQVWGGVFDQEDPWGFINY